jgi:hypothetical protein
MDRFISAFACRICAIMSKNVPVSVSWTELVLRHKIAESWGEIDFLRLIRELRRP